MFGPVGVGRELDSKEREICGLGGGGGGGGGLEDGR